MQFLYCGHISHRKHIPLSLFLPAIGVHTHTQRCQAHTHNHRLKQRASEWVCMCMCVYCLLAVCSFTVQYAWNNNKHDVYKRNGHNSTDTTTIYSAFNMALHSELAWLDWRGIGFTSNSNQTILFSISYDTLRDIHICMWLTGLSSTVLVCRAFFYSFSVFYLVLWFKLDAILRYVEWQSFHFFFG